MTPTEMPPVPMFDGSSSSKQSKGKRSREEDEVEQDVWTSEDLELVRAVSGQPTIAFDR